jgi:hypothetical protein
MFGCTLGEKEKKIKEKKREIRFDTYAYKLWRILSRQRQWKSRGQSAWRVCVSEKTKREEKRKRRRKGKKERRREKEREEEE